MATNEWGYAVLCTALSVTDDTALVTKSVVAEFKVWAGTCYRALRMRALLPRMRACVPHMRAASVCAHPARPLPVPTLRTCTCTHTHSIGSCATSLPSGSWPAPHESSVTTFGVDGRS
jgi:hypothetical protein